MVILRLERNGSLPLHQQITEGLRRLIDEGSLPIGSRLPPTRGFAENLGVNRATVYRAYEELWSLGYLEGRPGSFTLVRDRPPLSRSEMAPDSGSIRWESRVSHEGSEALRTFLKFSPEGRSVTPDTVDFSRLDMDESLIPVDAFRRCLNTVLRRDGARLLRYGARAGHELLREQIARRLRVHGIHVCADEIFIANGSQHALDLLIRTLADASRGVVVEAPTYAMMLPLLRLHGVPAIPVPMREDGMDLDLLERALSRPVAFVYTMPNFQNPTGISTTQEHRERLLSLCQHHGVPLVEDGFEEEMKYFGKVSLPIKSMDRDKVVIYLGTFSKILMPGLRIGWVAADKSCIQYLSALRRFADLSPTVVLHAAAAEFCEQGLYDLHLRRLHRSFRRRMHIALRSLREHLPSDLATWTEPGGGYLIWVELVKCGVSAQEAYEHLARSGVGVSPGPYYFTEPPPRPCFRLSIATVDEARIHEGFGRLGRAVREISAA